MATSTFSASMIHLHAANASARCGVDTAITTDASPTATRPVRWRIAHFTTGYVSRTRARQIAQLLRRHLGIGFIVQREQFAPIGRCFCTRRAEEHINATGGRMRDKPHGIVDRQRLGPQRDQIVRIIRHINDVECRRHWRVRSSCEDPPGPGEMSRRVRRK